MKTFPMPQQQLLPRPWEAIVSTTMMDQHQW
jgi:hypothetical protein